MLCRFLLLMGLVLSLSACAPVILGRTPTPAAPGTTETSVGVGYPVQFTYVTACDDNVSDDPGCFQGHGVGPGYWPIPLPFTVQVAYGRTKTLETNFGLMLYPVIGGRYGVKERFQEAPIELAYDVGGSLYLTNVGIDAGILAAAPLTGTKLYGALRGFATYAPLRFGGGVALTLGGEVPVDQDSSVLLELSFLANLYNNLTPGSQIQPVGFSLVPALAFAF